MPAERRENRRLQLFFRSPTPFRDILAVVMPHAHIHNAFLEGSARADRCGVK
jgi:hypothetical protein